MRNNSTMAVTNNLGIGGVGGASGAQSVLSQSNTMGVTKRHQQQQQDSSSKWLP